MTDSKHGQCTRQLKHRPISGTVSMFDMFDLNLRPINNLSVI